MLSHGHMVSRSRSTNPVINRMGIIWFHNALASHESSQFYLINMFVFFPRRESRDATHTLYIIPGKWTPIENYPWYDEL